jgi:hypothetical protein
MCNMVHVSGGVEEWRSGGVEEWRKIKMIVY